MYLRMEKKSNNKKVVEKKGKTKYKIYYFQRQIQETK